MLNNTSTPAAQVPANALTEDQAVDMFEAQGSYMDAVFAAFYRLNTRTVTTLHQGSRTYRIERLAPDVFVVQLEA
jgi:hypothetical protein